MAPLTRLACLALVAVAGIATVEAANIYKYVDGEGKTVYNSHVPPEFAKNGYTILNERGQVVRVVPRQLTPAEIAARDAAEQVRLAEEEAQRKQRETDSLLLRTYKDPAEIMARRDVRVMRFDNRLAQLSSSLGKVDAEIASLTQAIDAARAEGREPDAASIARLDEQKSLRTSLQNEQTVVEAEKQEEIALAERESQRLQELLGTAKQAAAQ